jgi:hypothetical protein
LDLLRNWQRRCWFQQNPLAKFEDKCRSGKNDNNQSAPPTRDSAQNKWSIQSCVFVTYYTSLNLSLQDILHEYFNYSVSSPSALLCPRPPPSFLSLSLQSDETTASKCSERSRQLGGVAKGAGAVRRGLARSSRPAAMIIQ